MWTSTIIIFRFQSMSTGLPTELSSNWSPLLLIQEPCSIKWLKSAASSCTSLAIFGCILLRFRRSTQLDPIYHRQAATAICFSYDARIHPALPRIAMTDLFVHLCTSSLFPGITRWLKVIIFRQHSRNQHPAFSSNIVRIHNSTRTTPGIS